MPSLPLLPPLPDVAYRHATSLAQALRGDRRRAVLLLGGPAEMAQAFAELGTEARELWADHEASHGASSTPLSAAIVTGKRAAQLFARALGAEASPFEALTHAGRLVQSVQALAVEEVVLWGADDTSREALWSAWVASRYELPALRSAAPGSKARKPSAKSSSSSPVAVPVGLAMPALQKWQAVERGGALARWLTALPGNHLTPALYRKRVQALARQQGWKMVVADEAALRRAGAGAFLAVAQGNPAGDSCLIQLQYRPTLRKTAQARQRHTIAPVALVGKGVCFDTGGVNLKPHRSMLDMHTDMAGSAVALGTLLALTELGHPAPADAWLALAENHLAAQAYKPQDVVVASNGTSIQIIHTDAEGRMLLADALALASRTQPRALVDFATLTGACVGALTERYAGLFTNRPGQRGPLEALGHACGERVWGFPLDADFDTELESKVADIIQCPVEGKGDHIYAARFLQRFVGEGLPWIHLDLAPATRHGGLGHITTDITGFGVRYATALLQDESTLQALEGRSAAFRPRTPARTP